MRRVISAALDFLAFLWVVVVGPFCWVLRDGLGPDSVESHGAHAIARLFTSFYWGPVLVALIVLRLLVWRRGA